MKIQLLPSSCKKPAELQPLTSFIINGTLAIDGGSIGFGLSPKEQLQIRRIVITHSHIDHTGSLPIFIAEVFPFISEPIEVFSTREIIKSLKEHIFNDLIWPDFQQIELLDGKSTGLTYVEVLPGVPFEVENLRITPVEVNHTVPTVGLVVEDDHSAVIFTSDTYVTDEIWRVASRVQNLKAIFVDVSYPNEMESLAAVSKHLTPQTLCSELKKLKCAVPIYAVHLKPQFRNLVVEQLTELGKPDIHVALIDHVYSW